MLDYLMSRSMHLLLYLERSRHDDTIFRTILPTRILYELYARSAQGHICMVGAMDIKQPSKLAHQSEDAINQLSIHIEQIKPLLLRSHLVPDVPNLYQDKITTKQKVFPRDQTFCFCNHSE